jgi:hypothetical protein
LSDRLIFWTKQCKVEAKFPIGVLARELGLGSEINKTWHKGGILTLNPRTRMTSPHLHIKVDNTFDTIRGVRDPMLVMCEAKCGISGNNA